MSQDAWLGFFSLPPDVLADLSPIYHAHESAAAAIDDAMFELAADAYFRSVELAAASWTTCSMDHEGSWDMPNAWEALGVVLERKLGSAYRLEGIYDPAQATQLLNRLGRLEQKLGRDKLLAAVYREAEGGSTEDAVEAIYANWRGLLEESVANGLAFGEMLHCG